uniref:TFIIS central domain-containing protein n=1 Tax=Gouania willdenowi TaxID=441366 RepID=A0A8C5DNN0_GOUWI
MPESEVAKLVASIETEMFDIFRNTDSKYMNKYRTIMFNLKDPRNTGLLYRVIHGEIGPFRLVRMSQKDMQATKGPEPSAKETPEVNNTRCEMEPQPSARQAKPSAVPDVLSCMLKDTTSEHKSHLFDLKCKICTGQKADLEVDEPAKKKPKMFTSRERKEPFWRKSSGDDSPLLAPPDSPETDSTAAFQLESPDRLIIDMPTLESPASPVIESPASPPSETSKTSAPKSSYTPVVIPAVSTVTITRRDPRTAASRFLSSSSNPSSILTGSHVSDKETTASLSATSSTQQLVKPLPKSILTKPSSIADPRPYGSLPRTMVSESTVGVETPQFLAKQNILWKGFLNMLTVSKFATKAYVVSGSSDNLKVDLPDTIQIGGRIMPQTVWDYVEVLKTSPTKELCVIRFQPATDEEDVAYVSLFSYFSSRGRFGVVSRCSCYIKDMYIFPLGAKDTVFSSTNVDLTVSSDGR